MQCVSIITENDNPENHCQYVFHNFIRYSLKKKKKCHTTLTYIYFRNVKAEKVAILAMGWGGHCFTLALNNECK